MILQDLLYYRQAFLCCKFIMSNMDVNFNDLGAQLHLECVIFSSAIASAVILGCHHAYTLAIVLDFKGNDNNLAEIKNQSKCPNCFWQNLKYKSHDQLRDLLTSNQFAKKYVEIQILKRCIASQIGRRSWRMQRGRGGRLLRDRKIIAFDLASNSTCKVNTKKPLQLNWEY